MFKKIIYNTGSQIVGKVVTASSTLLITLLIGRSLGPAGFGEFTKIFVFVGYFYTFADFGLNSIFVKLAKEKQIGTLFRTLLGLRLVIAVLLTVSAIIISFFLPFSPEAGTGFSPLVKTGILIASLTIITQALFTTGNALFQKNLRYDLSAIATIFGSILMVALTLFVSFTSKSIIPYVFVYIVGGITYVTASYFFIWKKFHTQINPVFDGTESKILLTLSWPIGIALILNLLYFRIDIFILASFRDSTEVGLYGLGYQFFQAGLAVPIFFANALYPILTKLYQEKITQFTKVVKMWTFYLIAASILLSVALFLVAYLIPAIYDTRFEGSRTALQILSLGMPFFFISALLWYLLIIYNKQKLLIYIYAIGAIFNLITNLIFIPIYGYIAAAVTTVVSEILILGLQIVALKMSSFPHSKN
jgi:O-antigen/teichoic acid export membrane protein